MNIAITGGIACGKSTVGKCFKSLGGKLYSADEMCHEILEYSHVKTQLAARWGGEILNEDNSINRRKIAAKVFENDAELDFLTRIVYHELFIAIDEKLSSDAEKWKFFEIPLLYEENMADKFDKVIAVWAPRSTASARTANWPDGEFKRRSAKQLSPDYKLECADFGIINAGDMDELQLQCSRLAQQLGMIRS